MIYELICRTSSVHIPKNILLTASLRADSIINAVTTPTDTLLQAPWHTINQIFACIMVHTV